MNLKDNNSFCALAWRGLAISPTGTLSPCCLMEETVQNPQTSQSFRVSEHDIFEVFNSPFMRKVREKMIGGERVAGCRQCYDIEKHGGRSMRIKSNAAYPDLSPETAPNTSWQPKEIDLKVNNICNLKCRMCQPKDSSLIYTEFSKLANDDLVFGNFENTKLYDPEMLVNLDDLPDWASSGHFIKQLDYTLPSLEKISIVGGEPLIQKEVYQILDHIILSGFSQKITLLITTNLMAINENKVLSYLKNFKKVLILVSIDALGRELNYIRYPSNIEKVLANYKSLYDKSRNLNTVFFSISLTIQVYNILYLADLLRLVEQLSHEGYPLKPMGGVSFTYVAFPDHLNIKILPQNIRYRAIQKLKDFVNDSEYSQRHPQFLQGIQNTIGILEKEYLPESERLMSEFLYYTKKLDQIRGQRLKDFLPELHQLVCEEEITASKPQARFHIIRERGWKEAKLGNLKGAIKLFKESHKVSPDKVIDLREMGWMYTSLGKFKDAINVYEEALHIEPENKTIKQKLLRTKGWWALSKGNHLESLSFFTESAALGIKEERYVDYKELGFIYLSLSKAEEAILHFKLALQLEPGDPSSNRGLVLSAFKAGKKEIVHKYLERALKLNPEDRELSKLL